MTLSRTEVSLAVHAWAARPPLGHLLREALDPISTVELEKPVAPLDEQRIDVYCELRPELPAAEALAHLGLVRCMARGREAVLDRAVLLDTIG